MLLYKKLARESIVITSCSLGISKFLRLIGVLMTLTSVPFTPARKLLELLDPKDGLQQIMREPTR